MEQAIYSYEVPDSRRGYRLRRSIPTIYSKLNQRGGLLCMASSETIDIGSKGCRLRLYHRFGPGDLLKIELYLGSGGIHEIHGRIVWLKKEKRRETWLAGIKFLPERDGLV